MINNNTFELSDEQLEAVTGGDSVNLGSLLSAGNTSTLLNIAEAPVTNISGFNLGGLSQSGSAIGQSLSNTQKATNS